MDKIKLHDLKRVSDHIQEDLNKAYMECIHEARYLRGPQVRLFEEKWTAYTGAEECTTLTSGTDALHTAGMIANIGPGDEVIMPAHTFVATAEAFVNLGATLKYVDSKVSDYGINEDSIEEQITNKTKAIVWTDVNGQTPDIDKIVEVAKKHNITTIDDAAMAHGATYKKRMAGTNADITAFSFGPVKPLGAIGGAGAITGSLEVCRRAREIRNHGRSVETADLSKIPRAQRDSIGKHIGWNRNIHTLQAGFLLAKLPYLNELNDMKRQHAFKYSEQLKDVVQHVPTELPDRYHVYHLYSILSNRRDELREYLNDVNIESLIHWKIPVNEYPFLTQVDSKSVYPYIAKQITEQILSLPCHPFLREDEQDYIIEHVRKFYEKS
jgi:dTDP-4-amino-4,6-dideoxygalactose transaminase